MKKRLLALLAMVLCAVMVLSFAACGKDDKNADDEEEEEESSSVSGGISSPQEAIDVYVDTVYDPTPEGLKKVLPDFAQTFIENEYNVVPDEAMCEEVTKFFGDLSDDSGTFTVGEGKPCEASEAADFEEWLGTFDVDVSSVTYQAHALRVDMDNGNSQEQDEIFFCYKGSYYSTIAIQNLIAVARAANASVIGE